MPAKQMSEEQKDAFKRLVTFVGIPVLTFVVGIFLLGIMLRTVLPD